MTPKEAQAIYHSGPELVIKLLCAMDEKIHSQEKRINELEKKIAQLSKDSTTSSKRPSSDDITKKNKKNKSEDKNQEGKSDKKIGGQPGHKKHTRAPYPPEEIDHFQEYKSSNCTHCHSTNIEFLDSPPKVIQQVELKEIVMETFEHQAFGYYCPGCDKTHYSEFPADIVKEGLFKERLTAIVSYMKNVCHCSYSVIRKFIRDVLKETVSRGYLRKLIEKTSKSLEKPYEELLNQLPLESNLNVDETGHKDKGERFWTWVFKADLYVLFKIDKSRGSQVLIEVLGEEFNGVLGCDYFSAYRKFMKDFNITVQFCIAHLIRDIKYLTKLPDVDTRVYGEKLLTGVKKLFQVIHHFDGDNEKELTQKLEQVKTDILKVALDELPSHIDDDGKEEKTEAKNMANRFRRHGESYFQFITTPNIDPTNNIAEQAIRFIVIDRHITQGTRSQNGRKSSERLWTVIATCAAQGRSAFQFILEAIHAYLYDEPPPSLLPGST